MSGTNQHTNSNERGKVLDDIVKKDATGNARQSEIDLKKQAKIDAVLSKIEDKAIQREKARSGAVKAALVENEVKASRQRRRHEIKATEQKKRQLAESEVKANRRHRRSKVAIIVSLVMAALVAIVGLVCWLTDVDDSLVAWAKYHNIEIKSNAQAGELIDSGKAEGVAYYYRQKLSKTNDNKTKAELSANISNIFLLSYRHRNNKELLQYAKEFAEIAESAQPTGDTAAGMVSACSALDDQSCVNKYKQLMMDRYKSNSNYKNAMEGT